MGLNFLHGRVPFVVLAGCLLAASPTWANSEGEMADLLITLLKVGRGVVSDHQALINDATKGDKGFSGDFLAQQVVERFRKQAKIDLSRPHGLPQAGVLLALLESEREVVDESQPIINKQGIGFKNFLPAVFARRTGERFYRKTGIRLKLTSIDYRYPGNRPDDFESEVLRMFADPRHPKGQAYSKATMIDGRPVMRMMDPEYASASCLGCHGTPKGERDITGGRKEGWKEGDLAGAISVVIPMR